MRIGHRLGPDRVRLSQRNIVLCMRWPSCSEFHSFEILCWARGSPRAKLEDLKGRALLLRSLAFGKKDSCPCAWMLPQRQAARRAADNLAFSMR